MSIDDTGPFRTVDIVQIIISFVSYAQQRVKLGLTCKVCHEAFGRVKLAKTSLVTLPELKEPVFRNFLELYGNELERLNLSRCPTLPCRALEDLGQVIPNLKELRLSTPTGRPKCFEGILSLPSFEVLEVLDATTFQFMRCGLQAPRPPLVTLHLWNAGKLQDRNLSRIIVPTLRSLGISMAPYVGSSLLRSLLRAQPALERLVLVQCAAMEGRLLSEVLAMVAPSLHTLKFWEQRGLNSMIHVGCEFPLLRKFVMDETDVSVEGAKSIISTAGQLEVLSLRGSKQVDDSLFANIPSLPDTLRSVFLNGSAITNASVDRIIQRCCNLVELVVESCRSLSRDRRLEIGKLYSVSSGDRWLQLSERGEFLESYNLPSYQEMHKDVSQNVLVQDIVIKQKLVKKRKSPTSSSKRAKANKINKANKLLAKDKKGGSSSKASRSRSEKQVRFA